MMHACRRSKDKRLPPLQLHCKQALLGMHALVSLQLHCKQALNGTHALVSLQADSKLSCCRTTEILLTKQVVVVVIVLWNLDATRAQPGQRMVLWRDVEQLR